MPESSPPRDEDEDEDADAEGEMEDDLMEQEPKSAFLSSAMGESPRGLKRSRNGQVREQAESGMADIARSYARDSCPAQLFEPDDVILKTEDVMTRLDTAVHEQATADRDDAITSSVAELSKLWNAHSKLATQSGSLGPESDDALTKATYLATLLFQLHHPHSSKPTFAPSTSKPQRSLTQLSHPPSPSILLPRALLDWLNTHHTPLPDDFDEVHLHRPSPAAHESFWDVLGADLLRGRLPRVIRLLRDAGWAHAATAQDDGGRRGRGYAGKQLQNTDEVIHRCLQLLETCPAVRHDDWDVKGAAWSLFRHRVRSTLQDMEAFAANDDEEDSVTSDDSTNNIFERSSATNDGFTASMSASTSRARSRVPWTIFENLKTLYGVLLGGDEIVDFAQDWLEAAVCLTVWWDGEEGVPNSNVTLAGGRSWRKSGARAGKGGTREVDVTPSSAYRRRLGSMFGNVTERIEEVVFRPDSLDLVQVALACVMEDDVESVVGMLRTWSRTVASAVVEVAGLGGWLPRSNSSSRGLLEGGGFSSEDLMVLSHGPAGFSHHPDHLETGNEVDRDALLSDYAEVLAARDVFRSGEGKAEKEGWKLAVEVLARLDDLSTAQSKIAALLDGMHVGDEAGVDKVLKSCGENGLVEQGRGIAEVCMNDPLT